MAMEINFTDLSEQGENAVEFEDCKPPEGCIHCIRASALAAELTDDQLENLCSVVEVVRLPKGEVIISEGEYDDRLYAIAAGEVEIFRRHGPGKEVKLASIGPGDIVGELAFLEGLKRTATVRAKGKSCVVTLRRETFENMIQKDPELVYKVMRNIMRSAHRTVEKLDISYSDFIRYVSG